MTIDNMPRAIARENDLSQRLQDMLYEFHALGRFDEAKPHIFWLMEIAREETVAKARFKRAS
jgi:hypothetical protein